MRNSTRSWNTPLESETSPSLSRYLSGPAPNVKLTDVGGLKKIYAVNRALLLLCLFSAPRGHARGGLPAIQCRLLFENIQTLGLLKWKSLGPQKLPEYSIIMAANGLLPLHATRPQVKHLLEIVTRKDLSADELRQALRDWALRDLGGLKLVFLADLTVLGQRYVERNLIAPNEAYVDAANGVVSPALWNRLVQDGYFPVVDPHDLLAHLPSFLDPQMRSRLVQKARLSGRLYTPLATGARNSGYYQAALEAVESQLLFRTRDETWENLNFLFKDASGVHLIPQGNHAMMLPSPLMKLAAKPPPLLRTMVASLFGKGDAAITLSSKEIAQILFPLGLDQSTPLTLPYFKEYIANRPSLYLHFRETEVAIGVGIGANAVSRAKVEGVILAIARRPELRRLRGEDTYIPAFMDTLATDLEKDSGLAASFNLKNRVDYMGASLDLYNDYLDWMLQQRPGSLGQSHPSIYW